MRAVPHHTRGPLACAGGLLRFHAPFVWRVSRVRGRQLSASTPTIDEMETKHSTFKDTTLFDWESEPSNERPSAFSHDRMETRSHRVVKHKGASWRPMLALAVVVVGGSLATMLGFVHILRAVHA